MQAPRKDRKQYRREDNVHIEDADAFRAAGDSSTDFPSRTLPLCHLPTTCEFPFASFYHFRHFYRLPDVTASAFWRR